MQNTLLCNNMPLLCNNMPLLCNNMPLLCNKDGVILHNHFYIYWQREVMLNHIEKLHIAMTNDRWQFWKWAIVGVCVVIFLINNCIFILYILYLLIIIYIIIVSINHKDKNNCWVGGDGPCFETVICHLSSSVI